MKLHAPRSFGRGKQVAILVVGQALFVGVGVWLHEAQLLNVFDQRLAAHAYGVLRNDIDRWAAGSGIAGQDSALALGEIQPFLERSPPAGCAVIRVDRDWVPSISDDTAGGVFARDQSIAWRAAPSADSDLPNVVRGEFDTSAGPHVALAWRLQGDDGYLVFHRPHADSHVLASSIGGELLALRVITLVWMAGILGLLTYMTLSQSQSAHKEQRQQSEIEALRQARKLVRTRDGIVFALATITDSRDPDTGAHLERICAYSTAIARAARAHPKFASKISESFVRTLGVTAALHDIGKVGIPDAILRKPGVLTREERDAMRQHTTIGGECLAGIARRVGDDGFIQMASDITIAHHERWDGSGYPRGLKGEEIPLAARIVAIADVYDALRSTRPYKASMQHVDCVERIVRHAGRHFDPDLIAVFERTHETLSAIASRLPCKYVASTVDLSAHFDRVASEDLPDTTNPATESAPSDLAQRPGIPGAST